MADVEKKGGGLEGEATLRDHAKLATSLSIVNRTIGTLITTLQDLDKLQQRAMGIGIQTSTAMHAMGDTIKGHPGGIKQSFESAMSLMQLGLFKHSKGMLRLMQVTKASGQNAEEIATGFAVLGGAMPLSSKAMGKLSFDMIDLTQKWGIQTTALMKVIQQNSKTLSRLSALGGNTEKNAKAIADMTAKAGIKNAAAIGLLAEKFSFEGGGDDLMKAVVQMGGRQDLVQRLRTEDMSEGLLTQILDATLSTYNQQVMQGTEDKFIRSLTAQGLTFDVQQIAQLKALQFALTDAETLRQQGLKQQNVDFSASLGTIFAEITAPLQSALLPWLENTASILSWMRPFLGFVLPTISKFIIVMSTTIGLLLGIAKIRLWWDNRTRLSGITLTGLIVAGIAAVGGLIYDGIASDKAIADTKKRDEDARQETALSKRLAHERYLNKALMASSLISQSLASPVSEKTNVMLGDILRELQNVDQSIKENEGPSRAIIY